MGCTNEVPVVIFWQSLEYRNESILSSDRPLSYVFLFLEEATNLLRGLKENECTQYKMTVSYKSFEIYKISYDSYFLTYHSFSFYISKLLYAKVICILCIHFLLALWKVCFSNRNIEQIYCTCLNFTAVLFLFLSSPWGSVYRLLISTDPGLQRSGTLLH